MISVEPPTPRPFRVVLRHVFDPHYVFYKLSRQVRFSNARLTPNVVDMSTPEFRKSWLAVEKLSRSLVKPWMLGPYTEVICRERLLRRQYCVSWILYASGSSSPEKLACSFEIRSSTSANISEATIPMRTSGYPVGLAISRFSLRAISDSLLDGASSLLEMGCVAGKPRSCSGKGLNALKLDASLPMKSSTLWASLTLETNQSRALNSSGFPSGSSSIGISITRERK